MFAERPSRSHLMARASGKWRFRFAGFGLRVYKDLQAHANGVYAKGLTV